MKAYFSIILAFILSNTILIAQQNRPFQHRCGYDHAVQSMEDNYPGYKAHVDAVFEEAKRLAAERPAGLRSTLFTIPVIAHVVWKETAENLAECRILEQIEVLNEAYQRMNADTANLRPIFSSVAASPQIELRLDSIIWKETSSIFYSGGFFPDITVSDKVKHSADGGSDALDPTSYMNIWFCNLGSAGLLGYAYPPANLPNWPANSQAPTVNEEGVVIDYRVVGRNGSISVGGNTVTTEGNTTVHEVGHYLGLRHIWGDGTLAIFGIPDCSADDGVGDTPNAGLPSNYQCDTTQNTCDDGAGDLPDMIENYMDYSSEDCQNSFTAGQVAVTHGVLDVGGARNNLTLTPPMNTGARPANDLINDATVAQINTDGTCTLFESSHNLNGTASWGACSGMGSEVANDVWFSFTADDNAVIIELSNIVEAAGGSADLTFELLSGTCTDLQSLGCYNGTTATVSGLIPNSDYYLRVYSTNLGEEHNFDLCLKSTHVTGLSHDIFNEQNVNVYPNPSSGQFAIELPTNIGFEGTIDLRNLLGQRIGQALAIDNNMGAVQLDLSSQPDGIYLIEITANGQKFAKKIHLQR